MRRFPAGVVATHAYIGPSRRSRGPRGPPSPRAGMLPYRARAHGPRPQGFGGALDARSLSVPGRSTSELLRTPWTGGCFRANVLAVQAAGPRSANLARAPGPWPLVRVLPLSSAGISTRRLTPGDRRAAFGVRRGLIGGEALAPDRSLYLRAAAPRLPLKAFRGVRAISQLDWPFTPTHGSSERVSTRTGSALQPASPGLQPGRG